MDQKEAVRSRFGFGGCNLLVESASSGKQPNTDSDTKTDASSKLVGRRRIGWQPPSTKNKRFEFNDSVKLFFLANP
jgi:hypothetical protein